MKFALYLPLLIALSSLAEERPAQFSAWGTKGPELAPLPAGWTEVRAEPQIREAPKPAEKDSAAGFILFQRPPFHEIYHDTIPAAHELNVKLQTFATQGEYQPLSFALHALEDLKGCAVNCSELKSKDGAVIPVSHIDIRWVRSVRHQIIYNDPKDKRFRMVPFYLEKLDGLDVAKGKSAQAWLTVKIPDAAAGGDYSGSVKIQAKDRAAVEIPLIVRVLPFHLPAISVETTMSYPRPTLDLRVREKELIDQREHGINSSESSGGAVIVSRDQIFGNDDAEATREECKINMELRRKVYGEAADKRPVTLEVGHQVLYYWDTQKNWFQFWPHTDKLISEFYKAVKVTTEAAKEFGKSPVRLFIMDEPGGHPEQLKETVFYNKLAKDKWPDLQTFCTIGGGISMGIDEIGQLGTSVDLLTSNRFTPDVLQQFLERKNPYGIYNGGSCAEAIGAFVRDRYFFGTYFWKTGASEILQWVYAFGDPWRDPIRGNHGYVYIADDGPLPSLAWEAVREGLDDYRYHELLWRLISAARLSHDAKAIDAAKAAEAVSRELMSKIDFNFQPKGTNGTPPPSDSTMQKWRWEVASACLDLLKVVPMEKALAAELKRPGPLEYDFPPEEVLVNRPELFPDSSFEKDAGPWKFGGGKGKGAIETALGYNSKASFSLSNPKDATGTDVAVCVWGWFGTPPSMVLAAGKTYEFSARLKCKGTTPQLRISLPAAAQRETSGESMADANGWKRAYTRVTIAAECKPKYFAVWLQGPGSVWCDDLSFREVQMPPIRLVASETLVDDSDRGLVVRVKQDGGDAPLKVIVKVDGQDESSVTVPPNGSQEIIYDASKWKPGNHVIRADTADGKASSTVTIERVRGPFEN